MSDGPIRKACDRCHRQKLSCKRVGDEACERCIRLKEECTSSPSLRYRKQHQQNSTRDFARKVVLSPKRQRTESGHSVTHTDLSIVKPQPVGSVCGNTGFEDNGVVSSDTMLDMVDFDFSFGHSTGLYQPGPNQQQPVPQTFSGNMDALMSDHGDAIAHSWSPVHSTTSDSVFASPMAPETGQASRAYLGSPSSYRQLSRSSKLHDSTPQRKSKKRIRQRARQIMLRPYAGGQGSSTEEWMPRITEVNSRLFELSSDLPLQTDSSEEPGRSSMVSTPDDGSSTTGPFPIDEMFKLSRHFADILAEMSPQTEVGSPASDDGNSQLARRLNSLSDPATCLFVLSTYVRLLDMYQKVFSCIHSELAQLESGNLFQSWKLPGVTVGSFAVDSTPSLQMSLTIQLAEEFLLQMRRATASLDPALRSDGSPAGKAPDATSLFSGVVDVSFQALKRQEESLGKELKDLRKAMEALLDG
ncbi:fungal transcriptional regulatory protein [Colletotrichum tofieldiae]|nr:fungal transcriptional regulatory protein [Colletotrichum tofieldiae]